MGVDLLRYKLTNYIARRVKLGGVLPNDGYITGVPKNIISEIGTGNVGTGLDTLFSTSLPATTFNKDGANLRGIFAGFFGANDDDKRLAMSFDATTIFDTGLKDIDGNGFLIELFVRRRDATHVDLNVTVTISLIVIDSGGGVVSGGMEIFSVSFSNLAVNNMDTGSAISLLLTGESATATNNNVSCNQVLIDLVRF